MSDNYSDPVDLSKLDIENLDSRFVDAKPVIFEFSGETYPERWDLVYPDVDSWSLVDLVAYLDRHGNAAEILHNEYWGDNEAVEANLYDLIHADGDWNRIDLTDEDQFDMDDIRQEAQERMYEEPDEFAPMMNYYYPYESGMPASDQSVLMFNGVSVVVVEVDGDEVLALSGGGMDLSWDICKSYILLGYLPPVHFCDLPEYARYSEAKITQDNVIIDACLRSTQIEIERTVNSMQWTQNKLRRLKEREVRK